MDLMAGCYTVAMHGNRAVYPAFTATQGNSAVPLLLHRREHPATFPTAIVVSTTRSMPPGCHCCDQEAHRPPSHHRCRVHAAWSSAPRPGAASSSRSSLPPGPRHLAITTAPRNRVILPTVTTSQSMPPQHLPLAAVRQNSLPLFFSFPLPL
jgi:hypothetical protein